MSAYQSNYLAHIVEIKQRLASMGFSILQH